MPVGWPALGRFFIFVEIQAYFAAVVGGVKARSELLHLFFQFLFTKNPEIRKETGAREQGRTAVWQRFYSVGSAFSVRKKAIKAFCCSEGKTENRSKKSFYSTVNSTVKSSSDEKNWDSVIPQAWQMAASDCTEGCTFFRNHDEIVDCGMPVSILRRYSDQFLSILNCTIFLKISSWLIR